MNIPTAIATHQERQGIFAWAGTAYGVDAGKVLSVLKATCFKVAANEAEASDAEVAGLLVVARAHNLNPFLREIFAFRDKKGGIVPVVGIDGWSRIINDNEQMDGVGFTFDGEAGEPKWCECTIHRKDRSKPTVIKEYFGECKRDTGPWKSHPRRMLRHKAMIQCARVAFGFAGIFDEDEAERIIEHDATPPAQQIERGAAAALRAAVSGAGGANPTPPQAETPLAAANGVLGADLGGDKVAETDATQAIPGAGGATKAAKVQGTPKLRKESLQEMAAASDVNELNLAYADAMELHDWAEADREALALAYNKRTHELKAQ